MEGRIESLILSATAAALLTAPAWATGGPGWRSLLGAALASAAAAHGAAVLTVVSEGRWHRRALGERGVLAWVLLAGLGSARWVSGSTSATVVVAAVWLVGLEASRGRLPGFSSRGRLLWLSYLALVGAGLAWGVWFVLTLRVGAFTRALMVCGAPLVVLALPVALIRTFENWEVICRRRWRRPHAPRAWDGPEGPPRVSIHVPAHAEPPEVVIGTLDSLARLDYPDFEVLVIDNNTADPALWIPVQEHCRVLGERFRFHHVEGLEGAKAGALNFALRHTDPAAELVALVDADYQAEPDFLAATVGHFRDAAMGFVQTPHAYRDWQHSSYLQMCAWEYAIFYHTDLASLNECGAAITVGTMCVIRRRALEEAGGWAEWCLTEDSELAIRLHALGYSSVYLRTVYGRGLIPETFAGYRRQRFRWSYGPVQEFARHWRLFLPGRAGRPSRLSRAQRIHHAAHGLYGVTIAAGPAVVALAAAVAGSMIVHHETVPLPFPLWLAATVTLASTLALRWSMYRRILGARLRDFAGAMLASQALAHTIFIASLKALVARPAAWQRTDKFGKPGRGPAALRDVKPELILAGCCLSVAAAGAAELAHPGLALMLLLGLAMQGLSYLAAPVLTLVAERDLARTAPRRLELFTDAHREVQVEVPA